MSRGYTAPRMPFALTVRESRALPDRIPGVASVEDLTMPPGNGVWRVLPQAGRLPVLDGIRPSMALLRFAGG